ncbi:hypothetical protein H9P43_000659 [Blastocladiella emersonii ATCC 22665]|nr:hypothetical protein H9P43_000659 [Blastocladiella emersonii ATCC 22665]
MMVTPANGSGGGGNPAPNRGPSPQQNGGEYHQRTPSGSRRQQQQQQQQQQQSNRLINLADYVQDKVIGSGSFGRICKVHRISDGMVMARKEIMYDRMKQKERTQLVQEVNILRELNHPHIVKYHGRIVDRNNYIMYIMMEYCEGGDLSIVVKRHKQSRALIPEATVWGYLAQLAAALHECHYLHGQRKASPGGAILHRDIKPDNVFLDADNNAKLGDFGLSTLLGESENNFARTFVGTPYYMSPEVVNSKEYNEKSDIWSLGCLTYELCALSPPFDGKDHAELHRNILNVRYSDIPSGYSRTMRAIISRMLQFDPGARPSAGELLEHPRVALAFETRQAETTLARRDRDLARRTSSLERRENEVARREAGIVGREEAVTAQEARIAEREAAVQRAAEENASTRSALEEERQKLINARTELQAFQAQLEQRHRDLQDEIAAAHVEVHKRREELDQRQRDLDHRQGELDQRQESMTQEYRRFELYQQQQQQQRIMDSKPFSPPSHPQPLHHHHHQYQQPPPSHHVAPAAAHATTPAAGQPPSELRDFQFRQPSANGATVDMAWTPTPAATSGPPPPQQQPHSEPPQYQRTPYPGSDASGGVQFPQSLPRMPSSNPLRQQAFSNNGAQQQQLQAPTSASSYAEFARQQARLHASSSAAAVTPSPAAFQPPLQAPHSAPAASSSSSSSVTPIVKLDQRGNRVIDHTHHQHHYQQQQQQQQRNDDHGFRTPTTPASRMQAESAGSGGLRRAVLSAGGRSGGSTNTGGSSSSNAYIGTPRPSAGALMLGPFQQQHQQQNAFVPPHPRSAPSTGGTSAPAATPGTTGTIDNMASTLARMDISPSPAMPNGTLYGRPTSASAATGRPTFAPPSSSRPASMMNLAAAASNGSSGRWVGTPRYSHAQMQAAPAPQAVAGRKRAKAEAADEDEVDEEHTSNTVDMDVGYYEANGGGEEEFDDAATIDMGEQHDEDDGTGMSSDLYADDTLMHRIRETNVRNSPATFHAQMQNGIQQQQQQQQQGSSSSSSMLPPGRAPVRRLKPPATRGEVHVGTPIRRAAPLATPSSFNPTPYGPSLDRYSSTAAAAGMLDTPTPAMGNGAARSTALQFQQRFMNGLASGVPRMRSLKPKPVRRHWSRSSTVWFLIACSIAIGMSLGPVPAAAAQYILTAAAAVPCPDEFSIDCVADPELAQKRAAQLFAAMDTAHSITGLLGMAIVGRVADRYGRPIAMATGLASTVLGNAVLLLPAVLFARAPWHLTAAAAVLSSTIKGAGGGLGAYFLGRHAWLADRFDDPTVRARVFAVVSGTAHVGWVLGPLWGALASGAGPIVVIAAASAALLAVTVALLVAHRIRSRQPHRKLVSAERDARRGSGDSGPWYAPLRILRRPIEPVTRGSRRRHQVLVALVVCRQVLDVAGSMWGNNSLLYVALRFGWGAAENNYYSAIAGITSAVSLLVLSAGARRAVRWLAARVQGTPHVGTEREPLLQPEAQSPDGVEDEGDDRGQLSDDNHLPQLAAATLALYAAGHVVEFALFARQATTSAPAEFLVLGTASGLLSMMGPLLDSLVSTLVPTEHLGTLLGATSIIGHAVAMVTPAVANAVYTRTVAHIAVFSAICVAARGVAVAPVIVLAVWVWRRQQRDAHRFPRVQTDSG